MIVALDSGIYISALEFGGVPREALIQATCFDLVLICTEIEEEVVRAMRCKFGHDPSDVRAWMDDFTRQAIRIELRGSPPRVCRDMKDDFLLECARIGGAELLITGDRDLLTLGRHYSTAIVTARRYLDGAKH